MKFDIIKSGDFMKNVYDIRMLLKRYGTFIYSGDRIGDLDLMEMELDELHQLKFISNDTYINSKLLLSKEKRRLNKEGSI